MQEVSIYFNHRASNGAAIAWKGKLERTLFRSRLNFRSPDGLVELENSLKQDIKKKVDAVVSVGGDGTAHTLIQNLAMTDVGLLVVPGGTANDLASELGNKAPVNVLARSIRNGRSKRIDLIKINNNFMATNGGIGMGQGVAQMINHLRRNVPGFRQMMHMTGKNVYALFLARELMTSNNIFRKVTIKSDKFNKTLVVGGIMVNNQPQVAGKYNVAPYTKNDDGLFNVVILTHPDRLSLIKCVVDVSLGRYPLDDPHFVTFETKNLVIENCESRPLKFFGDGEIFEESDRYEIEIVPQALKVFCGQKDSAPENVLSPLLQMRLN